MTVLLQAVRFKFGIAVAKGGRETVTALLHAVTLTRAANALAPRIAVRTKAQANQRSPPALSHHARLVQQPQAELSLDRLNRKGGAGRVGDHRHARAGQPHHAAHAAARFARGARRRRRRVPGGGEDSVLEHEWRLRAGGVCSRV